MQNSAHKLIALTYILAASLTPINTYAKGAKTPTKMHAVPAFIEANLTDDDEHNSTQLANIARTIEENDVQQAVVSCYSQHNCSDIARFIIEHNIQLKYNTQNSVAVSHVKLMYLEMVPESVQNKQNRHRAITKNLHQTIRHAEIK